MSDQWMTVAEAAAYLKVHPRTVERRMSSGKLETRRTDDGVVEVCIDVPDAPPEAPGALETVKELADRQVDIAAGSASAIVRLTQEIAERTNTDLMIARQELTTVRRNSRIAWISLGLAAGLLPVIVVFTVTWFGKATIAAQAETRDAVKDVRTLSDRLADTQASVRRLSDEQVAARQQLDEAVVARARVEGELAAYKGELAQQVAAMKVAQQRRPTTRPADLIQRVAQAFSSRE
ncbi:MAG TPA: helix-turn-helix domain-containing protein [Tepidisphaeraceae bacterium]|nr:helix-turn-helix domain-containing protein [Tepidisphaeraceae bacterium]